jgi:hypothetical protein
MQAPIDQNTGNNGQQEMANPILAHPGLRALMQQQIAIRDGVAQAGTPAPAMMPSSSAAGPTAPPISLPDTPLSQQAFPSSPQPKVVGPSKNEATLYNLQNSKPGLENVYHKITSSDWGQNHPGLGKLAGIAGQIPATAADLALSLKGLPVLGNSLSSIGQVMPGTTEQHNAKLGEAEGAVTADEANREKEAQTALQGAQASNQGAEAATSSAKLPLVPAEQASQIELQQAQTYRALHPLATSDFELWHQQNPTGTAQEYQQVLAKPLTQQDADSRNAIWDKIADQYHLPKGQFKAGMPSADAAQLAGSLNSVISRGQGAQSITIKQEGAGKAGDARSDRSFQYNQGELDKLTNPISQLIMRMGRLQDTINQNSPQADALMAPELLTIMAGGQGSGLRMNEAEISRIVGGRSNWESLKAAVNKWQLDPSKANSITPDQRQQIRALVKTVSDKLNSKQQILNQAAGELVNSDDPKEHRTIVQKARLGLNSVDEGSQPAQGGAKEGDSKTNSAGDKVVFKGGKWGPG